MSKQTRFVTATCACGATFEREVKRGRPQKWCAECLVVPFYERTQATVAEPVEGEAVAPKGSEHDDHADVRPHIEAEIAEVNAAHKERFAALVDAGVNKYVAADQIEDQLRQEIQAVYAKWIPSKHAA